ncbi:hypothetical protein I3843_05G124700 [Carya illinoinensis]|nr:hypothetical protein I3843_05G124700 [Carya illinoinensis]
MDSVWVFVWNFVVSVLGLIIRFVFGSQANDSKNANGSGGIHSRQDDQTGSSDSHTDGFREEEAAFSESDSKTGNKSNAERESSEYATASGASRYEFVSGKGVRGFLEGPEATSFSVSELYVRSDDYTVWKDQSLGPTIFTDKDFGELNLEEEATDQEKAEDSVENFGFGEVMEKAEQETSNEKKLISGEEDQIDVAERSVLCNDDIVDEVESVSEDCSLRFGSETESISSSGELSMNNHMIDSITYEVLASKNVVEGWEREALLANDGGKVKDNIQEVSSFETSLWGPREILAVDQSHDSDEEYIELEPHLQNLNSVEDTASFAGESGKFENKHEHEDLGQEKSESKYILEESKGTEPSESNSDYQNDLDFLWEHGDVLELLKMELRNLRTGGLPTILEEEEEEEEEPQSPAMVVDLKPLKIEEKLEFKDRMEEIQKVYKSYSEKMRKLDILNSQTMHAIGFLQLKEPVKSISMQKSSASAAKSLPRNIWPRKARRVTADPMHKLNEELQCNLELVYVGQVCLSWEILHWQHGKAQELQEYDSQGFHLYNQVAGEFQLFQVLLHRFLENEPFQGPRLQNYVNNRCVLRNLLQVPPIRDDCIKDKRVGTSDQAEEEHAISSGMIARIIEESMRVFWEFLRADKDEGKTIPRQKNHVNLQNDADLTLLMDIRADLQKKEKKLKDILRSANCIVKKFQKHRSENLGYSILFFAQVELKLVSRVLNMSRLTRDQLVWCHEKLDQISIVSRRIQVEPSFFLFPC